MFMWIDCYFIQVPCYNFISERNSRIKDYIKMIIILWCDIVICFFSKKKERSDQIRFKGIKVFKVCIGTFLNSTKNIFSHYAYDRALVMVCRPESKYEIEWSCLMTKKIFNRWPGPFWAPSSICTLRTPYMSTFFMMNIFFCF